MRGESILVSGLACTTKGRFTKEKNKTFHMKLFIFPHESMTQKKNGRDVRKFSPGESERKIRFTDLWRPDALELTYIR